MGIAGNAAHRWPWTQGRIVGQKASFKLKVRDVCEGDEVATRAIVKQHGMPCRPGASRRG